MLKGEYCLKLFMSFDLSDSTQYKVNNESWPIVLQEFQEEIVENIATTWEDQAKNLCGANFYPNMPGRLLEEWKTEFAEPHKLREYAQAPPRVWKTLGDEVIFQLDITHPADIVVAMGAMQQTMSDMYFVFKQREFIDAEKGMTAPYISIKGCAWLAPFNEKEFGPELVRNSLNVVGQMQQIRGGKPVDMTKTIDYIGKNIDEGFRVAKMSEPGIIVFSMSLFLLLTFAQRGIATREPPFSFFIDKGQPLKGVLGGKPYLKMFLDGRPSEFRRGFESSEQLLNEALNVTPANEIKLTNYILSIVGDGKQHLFIPKISLAENRTITCVVTTEPAPPS